MASNASPARSRYLAYTIATPAWRGNLARSMPFLALILNVLLIDELFITIARPNNAEQALSIYASITTNREGRFLDTMMYSDEGIAANFGDLAHCRKAVEADAFDIPAR